MSMTPDRMIAALSPLLDRVRRIDYWRTAKGSSPVHVQNKLTDAVMLNHVNNILSIGACPIERGGDTTRLAVLDLDSHKGETKWPAMQAYAKQLMTVAEAAFDIKLIPFRSTGGRGIHLYAIWDQPQDARSVRIWMRELLASCQLKDGAGKGGVKGGFVEVFPKQNSVPFDGWGSMFVLPMSGASIALDPHTLMEIELRDVLWPVSGPVPVAPPEPERETLPVVFEASQERLASALFSLDPNDFGYGGIGGQIGWLEILFAVHAATQGSDGGRAMIHEWSSKFERYSAEETDKQWDNAKLRPGGIGPATLFAVAKKAGWRDPEELAQMQQLFESVDPMSLVTAAVNGPAVLPENPFTDEPFEPLPMDKGIVESTVTNAIRAVRSPALIGVKIRQDLFMGGEVQIDTGNGWRPFDDPDYVWLLAALEARAFKAPNLTLVKQAVMAVADLHRADTGREWLDSLPQWDGVDRVGRFFPTYCGTLDNAYTRACSRYTWTALVGRLLVPGCQVDMVPVLVGDQGAGKSRTIKAMVPDAPAYYAEIDLTKQDSDQARLMRGKMIGEIAELKGLNSRDVETIKAFVTRTHEEWTPKYREKNTIYGRRCIFIGTTNQPEFLADETGNRRWLPLTVGQCKVEEIERDRAQLWAQALALYMLDGIDWEEAERLASDVHSQHMIEDPWEETIGRWLTDNKIIRCSARTVLGTPLCIDPSRQNHALATRVGKILRKLGMVKKVGQDVDGVTRKMWVMPSHARGL